MHKHSPKTYIQAKSYPICIEAQQTVKPSMYSDQLLDSRAGNSKKNSGQRKSRVMSLVNPYQALLDELSRPAGRFSGRGHGGKKNNGLNWEMFTNRL